MLPAFHYGMEIEREDRTEQSPKYIEVKCERMEERGGGE